MLPTVRFELFEGISHAVSTRLGGVSTAPYAELNLGLATPDREEHVLANRRAFFEVMDVPEDRVITGGFRHGNEISVFRSRTALPVRTASLRPDSAAKVALFDTDGVISDVPELHFLLTAADCMPLAFADTRRGVIGAAHAGWRGTAAGIAGEVIEAMGREFGSRPEDLVAGIGPSIGPCCYEVGPEVATTFQQNGQTPVLVNRDGGQRLDLWTTTENQLTKAGIEPSSIENPRLCTGCHVDRFYSHRAEQGRTGRFALLIGIA